MGRPTKYLTDSAKKRAKKENQRKWVDGRITLGNDVLEKWRNVQRARELRTDRDVATFLIDW